MSYKYLTPVEQDQIYHLAMVRKLKYFDIAHRYGLTENDVRDLIAEMKLTMRNEWISTPPFLSGNGDTEIPEMQEMHFVEADDRGPLHLDENSAVVFADAHAPHVNKELLGKMIAVSKKYFPHIKTAICAGDLCDFDALSSYPNTGPATSEQATYDSANGVIHMVGNAYETSIYLSGNHDERYSKKLDRPYHLRHVINTVLQGSKPKGKIMVTNYDYVYLGDKWMIGHPSNYSGQGGKTPSDICDVKQLNIATGHNHIWGMSQSKSGKYIGVDIGHMTDPKSHFYKARRMNKFAEWTAGFLIIEDGFAYSFPEPFTNWDRWL